MTRSGRLLWYAITLCFLSVISEAQTPTLTLPTGHVFAVEGAYFSPDGNYILTESSNEVKVWERSSGRLIYTLKGSAVESFYNAGARLITQASRSDTTGILYFWDLKSGRLLRTVDGFSADASENDSLIVIATGDSARVVDLASKKTLYKLPGQLARFVNSGGLIFTGSLHRNGRGFIMRLWDSGSGKLVHEHEGLLSGMSPNRMAVDHDSILYIVDTKTGMYLQGFTTVQDGVNQRYKVRFSPDDELIVFFSDQTHNADRPIIFVDGKTFEVIRTFNSGLDTHEVVFHPDGSSFFTIDRAGGATRWDTQTLEAIYSLEGHERAITRITFTRDNEYLLTASDDQTAILWDVATGRRIRSFGGTNRLIEANVLSNDGRHFANYINGNLSVWETRTGIRVKTLAYPADEVRFGIDDKFLIARQSYLTVDESAPAAIVVDATTWEIVGAIPADSVSSCEVSPDGKLFGVIDHAGQLRVSTLDGQEVFRIEGTESRQVDEVSFSPDGNTLFVLFERHEKQARLAAFDLHSGQERWEFVSEYINNDFVSTDDSRYLIVRTGSVFCIKVADGEVREMRKPGVTKDYSIYLSWVRKYITGSPGGTHFMINTPNAIAVYSLDKMEHVLDIPVGQSVTMVHFLDEQTIVYGDNQGFLHWVEVASGKEIKRMQVSGYAEDISGDILLTSDWTRQYVYKDFSFKYSLLSFDESDHLVMDQDGRYDGTDGARELVYLTCGLEIITLEQVKDRLWVPRLAERTMTGQAVNATKIEDLDICGYTPMVEQEKLEGEYRFTITPRRGGLGETVLYVNGIEVRRFSPSSLIRDGDRFTLRVGMHEVERFFVAGEENSVAVKAFTSENDMGSRGATLEGEPMTALVEPPSLYAVVVGVSDYKGDAMDLKFAAKDARDFANALEAAASGLFSFDDVDRVHIYTLHTDGDHGLFPDKVSVRQTFEEIGRQVKSNDVLLIFFAGHGITNPKDKQFYFMTADASVMTDPEATGISTRELFEWIQPMKIAAQKRILILDACNSGQAINDIATFSGQQYIAARHDEQMRYIKAIDKLNERAGLFILSASASDQSAYEMGRYSQGVLTYALLKPLKEDPGILDDNRLLNLSRWFDAAEQIVGDIARASGARQQPQIIRTTNFSVGVVDDAVRARITLPMEKPIFSNCNFQDEDLMTDNLRLNTILDAVLSDIASRNAEGSVAFFPGSTSPEAAQISGRYRVEGERITARVVVRQRDQILKRFEVVGTAAGMTAFADEIIRRSLE